MEINIQFYTRVSQFISKNMLLILIIAMQIIMFLFALRDKKHIENIETNIAYLYHILFTIAFIFGYFLFRKKSTFKVENEIRLLKPSFFIVSYGLSLVGLIISIITISYIYPLESYFSLLFNYQDNYVLLREIKYKSIDGGLSGIFKVFNYAPLGILFVNASLLSFYKFNKLSDKNAVLYSFLFALVCIILRMFFFMDRLSLLGILIVGFYFFLFSNRRYFVLNIIGLVFILALLSFFTSVKMKDTSVLDFISLYSHLGMINFQLLIDYPNGYSWGFNTFLHPLYFVGNFFNYDLNILQADKVVWDNAQYFYGYLYLDFGLYSLIILVILGYLVYRFQNLINQNKKWAINILFVILFAICTLILVPIFRAVEFWLLVLIGFIIPLTIKTKEHLNV